MTLPPWINTSWHWIGSDDPEVRRHVLYCLATVQLYLVCLVVMWHGVWLDLVPHDVARLITWLMTASWLTFFALIRSGWSTRLADPVLSMPHAMVSILIVVLAYALLGDMRGDVIVLLAQTIAVSMFRIRPRQSLFLGFWAAGLLGAVQFWLILTDATGGSLAALGAHAVVATATLLALALVAMWISDIRLKISRQAQKLQQTLAQVQSLATTDMLTGLLNRRQMEEVVQAEMTLSSRLGHPLCVAMVDLDHFKRVNDVYGHRMGDEVLRRFSALLLSELRLVDRSARWGGEEFLILMPHADLHQATVALERIRSRLAELPMSEQDPLRVTMSAGIAPWSPGMSLEQWLEQADHALYAAKHSGRNRVMTSAWLSHVQPDEGPGVPAVLHQFNPGGA